MLNLKDEVYLLQVDIRGEIDLVKSSIEFDTKTHQEYGEKGELVLKEMYRQSLNTNKQHLNTLERLLDRVTRIDEMVPEED